ncbi:hypothetical protein AB0L44_15395 [Nonomuraea wenchangensis]|uniref:hypothetical protein n=1 Tax=Nonomuraea wenchangensis TaxID=568860 RepID=UPI003438FB0D
MKSVPGSVANRPGSPPYSRVAGPPIVVHDVPSPSHAATDPPSAASRKTCSPLIAKSRPGSLISDQRPGSPS